MESERRQKFLKDFGIYTIGIIGMRMITFLMVPLYTYFIDKPSDYGYYDLCLSICMLLIPASTLQLREGAFRFLINNDDYNHQSIIISSIAKILIYNLVALFSLFTVIVVIQEYDIRYLWFCVALLLTMTIHEIMAQISRGLGDNKVYVASNLINGTFIGIFSIVFVAVAGWGIAGIFLSNIISRVLAIGFIEYKLKIAKRIKFSVYSQETVRDILRYCLPLIPIALCWSFTVSSGRFFIKYYLSLEANGIYAVSMRFTMILQTLSLIFYQTWQETAISQFNSKDRDVFFSKVFYNFFYLMALLLLAFSFFLKINYSWLVRDIYSESIKYVYPLCIAAMLNALSSAYFELGYQCSKETSRAIPGIIMILIVNFISSVILTPKYGIFGVAYASIFSYLCLVIYRFIDTRRYFHINHNSIIYLPLLLILISYLPFYLITSIWLDLLYITIVLLIMLYFAPKDIKKIVGTVLQKLSRQNDKLDNRESAL